MSHDQRHRYEWNAIPWRTLEVRVFKLQRRIYQATTRGETQKARRLQKLLATSWSAKSLAVRRVTQENKGKKTAGVDGVKSLTPPQRLKLISAMDLHAPAKPVRRIWIPKPGKLEERPLGIPIMQDRATQALVKLALEPEWEARFEPHSFGFRPGRSCQDAIEQIFDVISKQPRYVLDADIASCFDKINQAALLDKINTSPHFARPIKAWLKAGVVDSGIFMPTDEGTPQGGVCSPVMANLVLDGLEARLRKAFPRYVWKGGTRTCPKVNLIRLADDFVITGATHELLEHEVKPLVEAFLRERGLELSQEKTVITHIADGCDFLGQHLRKYHDKLLIKPSAKSIKSVLRKVRAVIKGNKSASAGNLICHLNPIIRGWARYHRHGVSAKVFQSVDHAIFQSLWRWAKRRHPNKGVRWVKARYFHPVDERHWVFSGKVRGSKGQPQTVHLFTAHSL